MTDLLQRIEAYKRQEIARARRDRPLAAVRRAAEATDPPRGFAAAVRSRLDRDGYAVIGEIKKSSPSKGLIRADFDPATLAAAYAGGGAVCLSVLTDAPSFQGDPAHLAAARRATGLPVLRKDFMIDPYQVYQARAWGADCVLVLLSMVDDPTARRLTDAAAGLGMDVLVEVHDEAELDRARLLPSDLIGINNRDLRTFGTTLETTERLAPRVPPDRTVVSESGIATRADLDRLATAGVRAFLVGEHLMRHEDVAAATRRLLTGAPTGAPDPRRRIDRPR